MIPSLGQLGPIPLNSFGLMLVLAYLATWRYLVREFRARGIDEIHAERFVFWTAILGQIGARLFFVFSNLDLMYQDPVGMLFSGAGFVFYGGFLGGMLAVYLVNRGAKLNLFTFGDIAAPALALGYGIGRIGCHLSGDGDYGIATALPWAFQYTLGVVPTPAGQGVHPAPIYESFLAFASAFLLQHCRDERYFKTPGQVFGLYLLLSSLSRFLVEVIRIEPVVGFGLTQAQWISIGLGILALVFLFRPSPVSTQIKGA